MSTAYNLHHQLSRALRSSLNSIKDPGSGGTVVIPQVHQGVLEIGSTGTRTLESASFHPVGLEVFVVAQASCTINTTSLSDGQFVKFIVSKNSAGTHEWVLEAVDSDIANTSFADDAELSLGTGDDVVLDWSTGDSDNHTFVIGLGNSNQALHITDKGAAGTDWNVSADTDPTLYIHSNTTPATDYLLIGGHDGTTAGIDVVGGTTLDLRIAGSDIVQIDASGITLASAGDAYNGQGSTVAPLFPDGAPQALSADGDITITEYLTTADTTSATITSALPDGAQVGHLKKCHLIVDGGNDWVITPANFADGTTVTLADVGDFVIFRWNGTNWRAVDYGNLADGTSQPAIA